MQPEDIKKLLPESLQEGVVTKKGKYRAPLYIIKRAEACARKRQLREDYAKITKIFEKHKWNISEESWAQMLSEASEEIERNPDYVSKMMDRVYGKQLSIGNPNAIAMAKAELVDHVRDGMYEAFENGRYREHQGYLDRLMRILGMDEEKSKPIAGPQNNVQQNITIFNDQSTGSNIVAEGSFSGFLKTVRAAMKDSTKIPELESKKKEDIDVTPEGT